MEPVITNPNKYNLVIFSASWCRPCRELIPILKKIYNDLKEEIDLVYISIVEQHTVNNWKSSMREEQIPWRSLLAVEDVKRIRDKYLVLGVPHSILVHPEMNFEVINLFDATDRMKLYKY